MVRSLYFFLVLLSVSLEGYGKEYLSINLFNKSNRIVNCYYIDNIVSFGHPVNLLVNDSVSIRSDCSVTLFISDAFQTMYIVKPGNNYYFDFKGRTVLRCISDDNVEKTIFSFFEMLSEATGPLRSVMPITLKDNEYESRQKYIEGLFKNRIAFLNSYLKDTIYSDFKFVAKKILKSYFIKESLQFPKNLGKQFDAFIDSYKNRTDTFAGMIPSVRNDYYPYREAAFVYNDYVENLPNFFKDTFKLEKLDSVVYKDYIAHKIALKILLARSAKELDSVRFLYSKLSFSKEVANEINDRLSDKYSEFSLPTFINNKVVSNDSTFLPMKSLFKSQQKTVYYVDFWASWCQPCRNEFKYYNLLSDLIKEKKIKLIFISMDDSYRSWKKANNEYNFIMNKGNSFLLLTNFKSNFATSHNISSIPRYMIIDQNGKMLDPNAPYPSDKQILNRLKSYFTSD